MDVQVVRTPEGIALGEFPGAATAEDHVAEIGGHPGAVVVTKQGPPATSVNIGLAIEGTANKVRHAGSVAITDATSE